jgi:type I restriction enzyme S subunit
MIADLKPYMEYKDSGSRWLGAVPANWEVRNLRTLISKRTERDRADLPLLSVAREKGVFVRSLTNLSENHNVIPEDLSAYKVARAGNLVINKMKAWQGSMGIAPCDGIVSPAYFVFEFDIANHAFGEKLLRSKPYVAHFGQASDGVRIGQWDLSIVGMRQIPVLVPPPDEQAAIVRFLEWANGRLERAIRAKRKVIGLLNEQKQAIIYRAVTRGLDPSVPLKPSGIPWLGDIPRHWEVRKLKHLTRFLNGLPFKPSDWKESGVPIIRIQNLNGSEIFNHTDKIGLPAELLIQPGDLLFAWSGNKGTSFGCFEWARRFSGYLNQHIFKLVGFALPKRYFYYLLRSVTQHVEEQAEGIIGLVHVTKPELGSVYVPIAPESERELIADHIDKATSELNTSILNLHREVDLLREYRTRLVADVVTGKLDIRSVAAQLPEEGPSKTGESDSGLEVESEIADDEVAV